MYPLSLVTILTVLEYSRINKHQLLEKFKIYLSETVTVGVNLRREN